MPTRGLLAAGLAAGVMAAPATLAPSGAVAASCSAAGSRTARTTPFARVYYDRRGRPFSCYRLTGRRTALDLNVDRFYARGDAHLGILRITKRMLGYTWIDPGVPAVYVQSVDMRTARYKRRTKIEPLVIIDPSAVAVPRLVVNALGSVAWIQRVEGFSSVWRFDRRGRTRIGGPTSARVSRLVLTGSVLRWRQAGRTRRATLR